MFCDRCGSQLNESVAYCPSCGKAVGAPPLMPVANRIAGHVRLLGILWVAISVFGLLPGVVLLAIFGHHGYFMPFSGMPMFLHG